MKDKNLQYYISYFLGPYLCGERGLSSNTRESYELTFKLLMPYLYETVNRPADKIDMDDFSAENIKGFLNHLEESGNSVATRNQRLAAIKSFCRYVQADSPRHLYNMQQILSIPTKRKETRAIQYLTAEQLGLLLNKPDASNRYGFRDLLILTVLADSGARVSEFIDIKVGDIRFGKHTQVLLHGKGNKDRWVPLTSKTTSLLRLYYEKEGLDSEIYIGRNLFLNRSGRPFTKAGITYILQKYTTMLHEENPAGFPEKLTPHCLRHTKAMIMLEAGQNLIYIRDILGHSHIKTTEIYARTDSKQIRAAIESVQSKIQVPDTTTISYQDDPELLEWLMKYCQ